MGSGLVRYKAEVDFDGKELTRSYLEKQDFETLLEEIQKIKQYDEMETFLLKHGENIVDLLGAEIDRIERDLRVKHLIIFWSISMNDIGFLSITEKTSRSAALWSRTVVNMILNKNQCKLFLSVPSYEFDIRNQKIIGNC